MSLRESILRPLKHAILNVLSPLRIGRESGEDRTQVGDFVISCVRALPDDPPATAAWDELLSRQANATAFSTRPWMRGVAQFFVPAGRLRVLMAHRAQQLCAVWPIELTADGALKSAGSAASDYVDPLVSDAEAEGAWRAMLTALGQWWDRSVNRIELPNLPETSSCRAILPRIAGQLDFACEESSPQTVLHIDLPATLDEYYAKLPKDDRIELRRRLKKAENEAAATMTEATSDAEFSEALERTIALMEARGGEKGEAVRKFVRPMLTEVGPGLFRLKRMRLVTLMLNNTPAGGLIVLPGPRGPMVYNTGFDLAQRVWGPGIVGNMMVLRQAISNGANLFDLLRGQEKYKYSMGAKDRPLYQLKLTPNPNRPGVG